MHCTHVLHLFFLYFNAKLRKSRYIWAQITFLHSFNHYVYFCLTAHKFVIVNESIACQASLGLPVPWLLCQIVAASRYKPSMQ